MPERSALKVAPDSATNTAAPRIEHVTIPPDRSFLWRKDDYPIGRTAWNCHPEVEIHLIRHSSGLAYVGDFIGPFDAGHLCIVGSNLPHNWVTPQAPDERLVARDIVIQFDPDPIRAGCAVFPEMGAVPDLLDRAARGIVFLGDTARRARTVMEAMDVAPGEATARFLGLLHLLATSQECHPLASQQFVQSLGQNSIEQQDKIETAMTFIQENYLDRPGLGTVARLVGMSESVFSRFFKHRTGNTFTEHVISLRISGAQKLLSETEEAITNICYLSGFNNIANFNRTFLRKVGMAPSVYRKAARRRHST